MGGVASSARTMIQRLSLRLSLPNIGGGSELGVGSHAPESRGPEVQRRCLALPCNHAFPCRARVQLATVEHYQIFAMPPPCWYMRDCAQHRDGTKRRPQPMRLPFQCCSRPSTCPRRLTVRPAVLELMHSAMFAATRPPCALPLPSRPLTLSRGSRFSRRTGLFPRQLFSHTRENVLRQRLRYPLAPIASVRLAIDNLALAAH